MAEILFGTAGVPHGARTKTTVGGIKRIAELRLDCMEIEFVRGVKMSETSARLIAETATKETVKLSAHAPYYINFNAHDTEKIKASQNRLLQTVRIASLCGAKSVVLHTAFYLGDPPRKAYDTAKKYLEETLSQLERENNRVLIRPEIMGKGSQFGTIAEILNLCTELDGLAPCIDFAHWHARTGVFNSYQEFSSILLHIKGQLGRTALDDMHIHISGIKYGEKGEIKHLNLEESDLQYVELLRVLRDYEVSGLVICESPNLENDALLLKETYNTLRKTDYR
ncbi:TIM barrel protein [Chloroflexota bacterium]